MRSFFYQRATDPSAAVQALAVADTNNSPLTEAESQPLAGGTTLIDLMKLDVMRPRTVVDINPLAAQWSAIDLSSDYLRLGAMARMSDVADNPDVQRHYPVIADALKLAASQQIRNMATLGGNVLQRTRCSYFRDVSYDACNKRNPGSGCAAMEGFNRTHAVLGTSDQCIASYPGDFAQALIALNASVEVTGKSGTRNLPFEQLHKPPGRSPQIETTLAPGELISGFLIQGHWPRSVYLKVRDRQSYSRWLRPRSRLMCRMVSCAMRGWRSVASPPCPGAPVRSRSCSRTRNSTTRLPAAWRRRHLRQPRPESTTRSRSNLASAWSHARCIRPRPWRFEHDDSRARTQGQYGPADPPL